MAERYAFDPELKNLARLRLGGVRLNRFTIAFANASCRLSCLLKPKLRGVAHRRYTIDGYRRPIAVHCYSPTPRGGARPLILYNHGGGFFMAAAGSMHGACMKLARELSAVVLLVDYSLAPKYPFPAASEDCYAALRWAAKNAEALGADKTRLAVMGDSAGGALSAALCLMARDRGGPAIRAQLLVYPVTDMAQNTLSMRQFGDVPLWNARLNAQMWPLYLKDGLGENDPGYASPNSAADLSRLPPTYIETAEFDCLRDEGAAFAARLRQSGVGVTLNETRGTFHGYDTATSKPIVKAALAERAAFLRRYLAP